MEVCAVVRLNESDTYDPRDFEKAGIKVYDLEFEDCTTPTKAIVRRFLEICEPFILYMCPLLSVLAFARNIRPVAIGREAEEQLVL